MIVGAFLPLLAAGRSGRNTAVDADNVKNRNFSFDTQLRYGSALVNNLKFLNVLVAAKMGRTNEAAQAFAELGGKVGYQFDPVGYFWGSIPTEQLPKLLGIQDIVDFELDGGRGSRLDYIKPTDPDTLRPGSVWSRQKRSAVTANAPKLPLLDASKLEGANPYLPWYLMGVPEFLREHPTFDGRGTTIAIVENGFGDLLHPALQHALTLEGKPVPKGAGILDASSPGDASYNGRGLISPTTLILTMTEDIHSQTNTTVFQGKTFLLPSPGDYKIARLENDGRAFWVLWSPGRKSVWMDTNQNNSFADEVALKDINRQFSAAEIPAEAGEPGKALARATSFAVSIDESKSEIKFFLHQSDHTTGVASIAAGQGFFGGKGNGIAPGARILYVETGFDSIHQILKAFILAASRPDVDAVTFSVVLKPPIGGETVTSLILDRLAVVYQKPMFFIDSAGMAATTDDVHDLAVGRHVFGVAGDAPAEVWHALNGVNVPLRDNFPAGGYGPAINGALKPDFVTPYHQLAATNCVQGNFGGGSGAVIPGYRLPPCYARFDGDSATTPEAAALAAILISGAKQMGIPYNLARVGWALRSGGRYLDQMPEPVGHQGNGLANLLASWKLFSSNEPTPTFAIASVSNGPEEDYRKLPHVGMGVYEYWGWHPGSKGMREVTITRSSGARQATHYELAWRGNDGTFVAPTEVDLPLDRAVGINIKFSPKVAGIHQAILEIVDPANGMVLHGFLNTVVASQPLGGKEPTATWRASIPLSHEVCAMFDVQPGVDAVAADITIPHGTANLQIGSSPLQGPELFLRRDLSSPETHGTEFNGPGTRHMLLSHPAPGPWAFCVRNPQGANDPQGNNIAYIQAEIKLAVLQTAVTTRDVRITTAIAGKPIVMGDAHVTDHGISLKKAALHVRIGYEEQQFVEVGAPGQAAEFDFTVREGTQDLSLDFQAGEKTDGVAVFIYNCPFDGDGKAGHCLLQDFREKPLTMEYRVPRSGNWKVLLYQMGISASSHTIPLKVQIVQIPLKDGQKPLDKVAGADGLFALDARLKTARLSALRKIDGVEVLGEIAPGKSVNRSFRVEVPSIKLPGKAVLVAELYDLEQEEAAKKFEDYFLPFDSTHSRPIALGRSVEPLPAAMSALSSPKR